jgi:hypothetical protein
VTAKVAAALAGVAPDKVVEARRAALTKLEQACEEDSKKAKGGALKCERVALYQGGQHWLYKYRRYDDVRLVFVPERDIAAFGGDPDNFQFPRWCLDMSILRAYENGKPAKTPNHLRFNWAGAQPGDPVFVSGHPGDTDRLLTTSQLALQRDTYLPFWLLRYSELRGRMIQYSKTGDEPRRTAESYLNQIENSIKVRRKQFDALLDPALLENAGSERKGAARFRRRQRLARLRERRLGRNRESPGHLAQHPRAACLHRGRGRVQRPALPACPRARALRGRAHQAERVAPAGVHGVAVAGRAAEPQGRCAHLPRTSRCCGSPSGLERMREWLGPDDPVVRRVFGNDSPDTLANRLVRQSSLVGRVARVALYEGGQAAIDASQDPMIRLAAAVDPDARALRKQFEEEVDGPTQRGQEEIAKGPLCRIRHEHLPGCDLYAPPLLRRDERLGREGAGSPPVDRALARLRARDRRAARSRSRRAGWPRRAAWT